MMAGKDPKEPAERKGGSRSDNLNIRFSDVGRYILNQLQEDLGLSQASVVEMLLREEARRRGINIPGSGADLKKQQEDLANRIRRQQGGS